MLASLRKFAADEVAKERWKIIQFYGEHGEAETQKYLGANRKTIHVWKKRLAASGQHLGALVAHSTRPMPGAPHDHGCAGVEPTSGSCGKSIPAWGRRRSSPCWTGTARSWASARRRSRPLASSSIGTSYSSREAGRVHQNPSSPKWAQNAGKGHPAPSARGALRRLIPRTGGTGKWIRWSVSWIGSGCISTLPSMSKASASSRCPTGA